MYDSVYISKCMIEFSEHATESSIHLREGLTSLFPATIKDIFLSTLKISQLEGFYKNPIQLWTIESSKKRWNDIFFTHIMQHLLSTVTIEDLLQRYNDDDSSLYIRLNKQLLVSKKQYILDQGSDVIKILFRFRQNGKVVDMNDAIKQIIQKSFSV